MKNVWKPLQHKIFRELGTEKLEGKSIVVAISGGEDSVALLSVLNSLSSALKFRVSALHVHHGKRNLKKDPRDQAQKLCEKLCAQLKIPLEVYRFEGALRSSEADFRRIRLDAFQKTLQNGADFVALGHHLEDLLETRVLRLIRGVGSEGLASMKLRRGKILRPFLNTSKKEITAHVASEKLKIWQDPTNTDVRYLRNWIRRNWLTQLERRAPGAKNAMARSLDLLSKKVSIPQGIWQKNAISQTIFQTLSVDQQRQVIASYLFKLKAQNYRASQVKEIIKHLDKAQSEHTFRLAGLNWKVNAQQILAQP